MIRVLLLLSLSALIIGCSSKPLPSQLPFSVTTHLNIGAQVNPFNHTASHPIVLRIYQLRESGAFNNAGFIDLYLNDRDVLGASLIDAQYLKPVSPGQKILTLDIQRDTLYIAVLAEFSDYSNAVGKSILRLDRHPDQKIMVVHVNGLVVDITMQAKPKKAWWQKE